MKLRNTLLFFFILSMNFKKIKCFCIIIIYITEQSTNLRYFSSFYIEYIHFWFNDILMSRSAFLIFDLVSFLVLKTVSFVLEIIALLKHTAVGSSKALSLLSIPRRPQFPSDRSLKEVLLFLFVSFFLFLRQNYKRWNQ